MAWFVEEDCRRHLLSTAPVCLSFRPPGHAAVAGQLGRLWLRRGSGGSAAYSSLRTAESFFAGDSRGESWTNPACTPMLGRRLRRPGFGAKLNDVEQRRQSGRKSSLLVYRTSTLESTTTGYFRHLRWGRWFAFRNYRHRAQQRQRCPPFRRRLCRRRPISNSNGSSSRLVRSKPCLHLPTQRHGLD